MRLPTKKELKAKKQRDEVAARNKANRVAYEEEKRTPPMDLSLRYADPDALVLNFTARISELHLIMVALADLMGSDPRSSRAIVSIIGRIKDALSAHELPRLGEEFELVAASLKDAAMEPGSQKLVKSQHQRCCQAIADTYAGRPGFDEGAFMRACGCEP